MAARMPELYVDGAWSEAKAGGRRSIRCPADGTLVGEVDEATAADADRAIAAAYRAFHEGAWPGTSTRERGDLLLRVADLLERDSDDIALAESPRHRQAAGREPSTTWPTWPRCSATTAGWPPRTPDAWSTPATPTSSAGSSTSRSACAG